MTSSSSFSAYCSLLRFFGGSGKTKGKELFAEDDEEEEDEEDDEDEDAEGEEDEGYSDVLRRYPQQRAQRLLGHGERGGLGRILARSSGLNGPVTLRSTNDASVLASLSAKNASRGFTPFAASGGILATTLEPKCARERADRKEGRKVQKRSPLVWPARHNTECQM